MAAAQVVQANLADVGVTVNILPLDSGAFWTYGMEAEGGTWQDLQLLLQEFITYPDPGWISMWFVCEQVGVWNWERWCSEEFSSLHNAAMRELDPAKRDVMYRRMQDLMEESGSYRFLTNGLNVALCRDTVEPAISPSGTPLFHMFAPAST